MEIDGLAVDRLVSARGELIPVADHNRIVHLAAPLNGHAVDRLGRQPDWNGCPPVALPGDVPVWGVLNKIGEPLVTGLGWVPLAIVDVCQQVVFDVGNREKPLVGDDLDNPRVTPPAMPVRVLDGVFGQQVTLGVEISDNSFVRVADELPGVRSGPVVEPPVLTNWTEQLEPELGPAFKVLLAVSWRRVHQPSPVDLDVVSGVELEGLVAARMLDPVSQGMLVLPADHLRA